MRQALPLTWCIWLFSLNHFFVWVNWNQDGRATSLCLETRRPNKTRIILLNFLFSQRKYPFMKYSIERSVLQDRFCLPNFQLKRLSNYIQLLLATFQSLVLVHNCDPLSIHLSFVFQIQTLIKAQKLSFLLHFWGLIGTLKVPQAQKNFCSSVGTFLRNIFWKRSLLISTEIS